MLQIFKNKLFVIFLITLVIFIVIGVSTTPNSKISVIGNSAGVLLAPVQGFFTSAGNRTGSFLTYFKDIKKMKEENEQLKSKVAQLEDENSKLQQLENKNKELRDALNIKDQFSDYEILGANIISKDAGNWFNIFKIDRGSKDGVENNFPVITSKGLVGMVIGTDLLSSKVMSLIDNDTMISARLSKSRELVRVKGDLALKDEGLCLMDHIPLEADISVGDSVETSGVGGIFPKGITIGKINEIRKSSGDLSRYAIIGPAVDFKRLEEVLILKSKNIKTEAGSREK